MTNGISIEKYLEYLDQQDARNLSATSTAGTVPSVLGAPSPVAADPWAARRQRLGLDVVDEVASDNAVLDFLGSLAWGGIRGLTWGASEFVAKSKPWDQMNDWERAGWVTGEGLSLFTPFVGPFALIGKGGQVATRTLGGNKFIRKAASELVKKEGLLADQIVTNAAERGVITQLVARDLKKQFSKQLPKALKDKYSVSKLRDLTADARTAQSASVALRSQSEGIISKILTDSGMDVSAGMSRDLSEKFVKELGRGRYVNDIGEWVTRAFGNRNPGRVSQYLGMAAQDFLYLGLHAVGVEKIDSMAHDRSANYSDIPSHVGIMSLGFPLIRGIGRGGRESLSRGIGAYFQRYRRINYNKISKMTNGDPLARELLRSNVNGANLNIINSSKHGEEFYKIGGVTYKGKQDILSQINTMPLDHTVGLLNKMRKRTSQEFVDRFKRNYFGDLVQSLPRMGTGILFMNYGAFASGAFDGMSEQELASHLFMAGLMTKGKGAWDHAGKRGYIHDQYGDITKALNFLQVDHTKILETINVMKTEDFNRIGGAVYGHNPIADKILNTFDSIFEGEKIAWRNNGEVISHDKYAKVEELLGAYNAIKKSKDMNYDLMTIDQMNINALDMVKRDLGSLKIGEKTVDSMHIADIAEMLSAETEREIRAEYYGIMDLLREKLEMPFSTVARVEGAPLSGKAYEITGPEGVNLPNIMEWNSLLKRHSSVLNIDVISGTNVDIQAQKLADNMGMKLKDFDNAIGNITHQHMVEMGNRHLNHNLYLKFHENIFLDGLSEIKANQAKADIYRVVTGIDTDKANVKTLREDFLDVFGRKGRLHEDIYRNEIDGKVGDEISEKDAANIAYIKPLYDLIKNLSGLSKSEIPKTGIKSGDVQEVTDKAFEMISRLPSEWRNNLYEEGLVSFQQRIFSQGNPLSYTAFRRAVDAELVYTINQNGIRKIVFPTDDAIDHKLAGDNATATRVKEAVNGIKNLFTPQLIASTKLIPLEADMLKWISIHDEISHSKVKDFVDTMPQILEGLGKDSMVVTQIRAVKDLSNEIRDEITSPKKEVDTDKIKKAIVETETIHKVLLAEGNIDNVTSTKMEGLITALKTGYDEMIKGGVPPPTLSIANYGQIVKSIDEMIIHEVEADHLSKTDLSRLLIKIENHITGRDPNISYADGKILLENLTERFHMLLGNKVSKEIPLQELIDQFNNTGNWRDARTALDAVIKMGQSYNLHHESYNKNAERILNELQGEKLRHERPVNFQELLTKYPSLQDPLDPNAIRNQFVTDLINAFDPAMPREPKDVLEDYIYRDIRKKFIDSSEQLVEIEKFNNTEMQPLLQNIFGKEQVKVLSLDGSLIKYDEKPMRYSLSTMVLNRKYTSNPELKYDYVLLEGMIKLGNRSINMDESYEIGGDWITMQNIIDKGIPVDMSKMRDITENLRSINFELQIDNLTDLAITENSSKVYMRLSPKMRIIFPKTKENIDLLNRDFDTVYSEKEAQYSVGAGNKKRLNALRKGFKHLFDTTEQENDILRLKMLFVHYNRTMGPEFDNMMNKMDQNRGKIEFNSYKRGFQADGSTSTVLTKEALEWSARWDADPSVRAKDRQLLDKGIKLAVLEDQAPNKGDPHFFSNKSIIQKQLTDKVSNIITATGADTQESKIINNHLKRIDKGEFTSLESYFLDGGKFAGTAFARSIRSKKGGGQWNGMKTTIMTNDMLGKGFTVYSPEIAYILDGLGIDLMVGKTVAKTLNTERVTPFRIDPAKSLERGWEAELIDMKGVNFISIPYDNFGISFTTHSDPGVNYSSSMFDFQSVTHLEQAKKLYKIDQLIDKMGSGVNNNKDFANGDLLRALYKIRHEESGQQLTTDSYSLTEALIDYGARESNPLVQRSLVRLLQSDFYSILTKRSTPHGEEGIFAPDVNNILTNPVYAQIEGLPKKGSNDPVELNSIFQYGGGSITHSMANQLISRDVSSGKADIDDIPFIARDKKTGLHIVFSFSDKGLENHSPLLEAQKEAKTLKVVSAGIKGLKLDEWIEVSDKSYKEIESVLNRVNELIGNMKNVRYNDLIRLLDIDEYNPQDWSVFPKSKMIREDIPVSLGKKYIKLADKYDIHLGMSLNAIPKIMKDQPLVRIEQVLAKELSGLATLNSFDLRVTLQRDYDGDHGYKYLKMPMSMLKDYTNDMGDITDYRPMDQLEYTPRMNMFGFEDGVAGKESQAIGFDRVAHDVAKKKRIISSVISRKGTLSYLLNSKLKLDKESFVSEEFNDKNIKAATTKAIDIFQRGGEIFQSSFDFWNKTPIISNKMEAVENYFVYGEHTNYDNPSISHSKDSFLRSGFGSTKFQKSMFRIMHRTLSKARIMDNEVHDAAGQRQPSTDELRRARRNIISFFKNPDMYLIKELLGEAKRLRRQRNPDIEGAKQIVKDIIDFFYSKVYPGSPGMDRIYKSLRNGVIPVADRTPRFSAEGTLGIKSSMSGHILDEAVRKPLFYESDNLAESKAKNNTIFLHYNRLKNKLEVMFAFGDVNPDKIDEMILQDKVFTKEVGGKPVFDSNMSGILSFIANSQHSRLISSLRMLKNENFPDANKIERAEDRLKDLRNVIDALDRQMTRDVVLRKEKDLTKLRKIRTVKDGGNWEYIDFNAFGNLYRIRGDVSLKELDVSKPGSIRSIEYMRPVKKGRKVRVERGYTYFVDKRPPKFMSVDNPEVRWNKAFMAATQVGILKARNIDPRFDPDASPIIFSKFVSDIDYLRRGISDSYNRAREAAKENLIDKGDIFYYNSVQTDRRIGRFFKEYSTERNFEDLLRYLLQPQVQRNVYFKEGALEMPYHRMNTHLIESVFNWMRRPAQQGIQSNEEAFGFNAEALIRSIIKDTNAFHDHKLGHVEYKVQEYNRMRMGGKEDWNRLQETTTDILLKDWYHNPVLSKYSRDFFLGRGDIVRDRDVDGKDGYFYDYRKGNVGREMEKIMGCK